MCSICACLIEVVQRRIDIMIEEIKGAEENLMET